MRFRSITKWKYSSDLEGLLFFCQRADELLFDYTLDSYKPSALNSVYLCAEAIKLITDIEKEIIDKANLHPVLEELAWSITNDPVAKSLLDLPSDKYLLNPESEPLQRVRIKLEALGRTLEPYRYLERCCENLSQAVKSVKKSDIDMYAKLLFTTLLNLGMHKSHLYDKTIDFFYRGEFPASISSSDAIDDYLETIRPYEHEFEVTFLTSSLMLKIKDSAEKAFRVKFFECIPEDIREFCDTQKFKPEDHEVIAQISKIRALDCHTAREKAEAKLGQLRDLFKLYHHKNQISWRDVTVIRQCCTSAVKIIGLPKNPIEKGFDQKPEKASEQLNRMLKGFRMEGENFHKFNRAVDFHGLSVSNTDPENQLLNLWIALETIVPTHTRPTKIKQIADGILPFISMNYFWRLVSRLAQDLVRWNKKEVTRILRMVPDTQKLPLRTKIFLLLVDPNAQQAREMLFERLRDFHLLRFRIFTLAKSLATPKMALSVLELHEKKVAWQIRRIYRTRNLIVHSGRTPPYIQSLIENGHDYLDQVILTIIQMSGSDYRVRTIEQAFELAHIARRKLDAALKGSDKYTQATASVIINESQIV